MNMPFGKYKGETVESVPSDYLEWFLGNIDPPPIGDPKRSHMLDLMSEIEEELGSRRKYGTEG